jgi:Cu2+-exporting ATPase
VLLLARVAAAAWSVIDPARAVWVAVSVLIVTCPCALSLAAPAALVAAAGGLARRGVLFSGWTPSRRWPSSSTCSSTRPAR